MARIMCAQRLWHALGQPGKPPRAVEEPHLHGAILGTWAAGLTHYQRRGLVIAVNERTCLTLVFPLAPRSRFRTSFATALAWALEDLGVSPSRAEQEASVIDFLPLSRLTLPTLAGTLNDLEFHCAIELSYTTDFRRVQRNLNELPHAKRDPCVPADAIGQLFSRAPEHPTTRRTH